MYKSLAVFLLGVCVASAAEELQQADRNPLCTQRNIYLPVDGSCDSYLECRDFSASEMLCPDGLHYNPKVAWPAYPCGYPMDVPCKGRGVPQPAIPTADCPHQFGFYPSPQASPENCGMYRMCVDGNAIDMQCPAGLAFNPDTAQCDWPELVSSCNVEAYLGFSCPAAPLGEDGKPLDIVMNYKYEGNCYAFYSCKGGHARLLTCDAGFAFDPSTERCEDATKVACA